MVYLKIGEVAALFGVEPQTIRVWVEEGKLDCIRTPHGHRRFDQDYIFGELNHDHVPQKKDLHEIAVLYARVSTKKQAESGNLDRQVSRLTEYAVSKGLKIEKIFKEVASGVNENRKELQKLLSYLHAHKNVNVLIEYKDRLARFGYAYLERYISDTGNQIYILDAEEKDEQQELVEDLIAITTSFSARIYGKRGGKKKDELEIRKIVEEMFS